MEGHAGGSAPETPALTIQDSGSADAGMHDAGYVHVDVLYDAEVGAAGVESLLSGDAADTCGAAAQPFALHQTSDGQRQVDEGYAHPLASLSCTHAGSAEGVPAGATPSLSPAGSALAPPPQQRAPQAASHQV